MGTKQTTIKRNYTATYYFTEPPVKHKVLCPVDLPVAEILKGQFYLCLLQSADTGDSCYTNFKHQQVFICLLLGFDYMDCLSYKS